MNVKHFPFLQTLLATGVVTSPNYPGEYPNNLEKTDTIQVERGLVISLHFTYFDIEVQYNFDYEENEYDYEYIIGCSDHLTITDGDGTTLMEKSCGSTYEGNVNVGGQSLGSSLPAAIRSTSNIVNLLFSTDNYDGGNSGWSVNWSAVTPGECQQCNLVNLLFPFNKKKLFNY